MTSFLKSHTLNLDSDKNRSSEPQGRKGGERETVSAMGIIKTSSFVFLGEDCKKYERDAIGVDACYHQGKHDCWISTSFLSLIPSFKVPLGG